MLAVVDTATVAASVDTLPVGPKVGCLSHKLVTCVYFSCFLGCLNQFPSPLVSVLTGSVR